MATATDGLGAQVGGQRLVLEGATVLDGAGGPPQRDAVVVIEGDRIVSVQPPDGRAAPAEAERWDLRGKWLLPGLIDAHVHAEQALAFAALRRWGVTAARNPAATRRLDEAPAAAVGAHSLPAPPGQLTLLRAGVPIDGRPSAFPYADAVSSEGEVRQAVRGQVDGGADFVKLYVGLGPALVRAGVDQAHQCGVAAAGDLVATSWTAAAEAGIDFLCHAWPRNAALLPEPSRSAYEAHRRAGRPGAGRLWLELVELDRPEVAQMIEALVSHGVVVDPTLVSLEQLVADGPDGALWPKLLGLVRRLHDGGVTLLAGTDAPRPGVPAGESLHREIELLTEAGLSCSEALAAATGRAAQALGIGHETGSIEPGKRADLLLLGSDPLVTPKATRDIVWSMAGGVVHQPESWGEG